MPELPEVESVVRMLRQEGVEGCIIRRANITDERCIAEPEPLVFVRMIRGRTVESITRRGKYIVMVLDNDLTLLIHLRMTGRILFGAKAKARHVRVSFLLNDGRWLQFFDTRRFGEIWLTDRPEKKLDVLGPEPLGQSFTAVRLKRIVQSSSRAIKALLLDQHKVAGLGNIYCDEALWEAQIHPLRPAVSLNDDEVARLHKAIRKVLRKGIRNFGTTLGAGLTNFQLPGGAYGENREELNVYGRAQQACPRCGRAIERLVVAQRGTHVCVFCQS
jgi:formamidopyrimidine-DNA glycosylase